MSLLKKIKKFFSSRLLQKKEDPLYADCAQCGKKVYLPYRCHYCNQYYCGEHRLPFSHDCRNINEWKNRGSVSGPATEYRSGRVHIRK